MTAVFRYCGYSKQAFHQKLDRMRRQQEQEQLLIPIVRQLRQEHPGVSVRQLYWVLQPQSVGRDKFELLCYENGFKLQRVRCFRRTTDSTGVIRFPNLVIGREFTGINQGWSSDITYYQIGKIFYYLTLIMDLFSRRIVGFHVSKRLYTEQTTIPALEMAISQRRDSRGVILHSDGGGQYYSKAFLELTKKHEIRNSMCDIVYENAMAERINGTIKNQYLKGYGPTSFSELEQMTQRAVKNYNFIRPHTSLNRMTPVAYEQHQPAGGSFLQNDDFCNSGNHQQQRQKNHHFS